MKRNLSRMFRTGVAAAAALLCAMPFQAAAEDYPSRPITLIMPFGAGNAPDTAARIIGDYLQRKHNITLLITSKPGGSGIPATLETVRARPDGYTISLTSANVLTVVPQYKKCGFTYKDLAPVAQVNVFTMGWGVRADSGIASVQDLMDKAKAERGKYSLASPGAFTAQRFYHANVMKLFPESDLPYVAYNGGAEIVTALLGNHISAGFTPVVNFKPHKDIRVIAVCGAQRDPNYPDAPTFNVRRRFRVRLRVRHRGPAQDSQGSHRTPPEPDQGSPQRSRRAGQVRQGQHDHQLPPRRRIRQGHRRVLQAL